VYRGDADTDLTSPLVIALGRAAARVIGAGEFLIGRDTRESGPRIEADLTRGLNAGGRNGCVARRRVDARGRLPGQRAGLPAAIVSASHNPWSDTGVKLVGRDGRKLADDLEAAIEAEARSLVDNAAPGFGRIGPDGGRGGRRSRRVRRPTARRARGPHARGIAHRGRLRERRRFGARAARVARRGRCASTS